MVTTCRKQRFAHILLRLGGLVALAGCDPPFVHTQEFGPGQNKLEGKQLYFIPTPRLEFYQRMVLEVSALGNDPAGDFVADVSGGPVVIDLGANAISFFGELYDTLYLSANGTIGMGVPGNNESLNAHFLLPQVSLLPVDVGGAPPGSVTYDIVDFDSVAVTYAGVQAGGAPATAQAEFIIRQSEYGDIALTYTEVSPDAAGVIGLSPSYTQQQVDELLFSFGFQPPLTTEIMTGNAYLE